MQGLCCCTAAFRLCYLDNVTAAGTTPPTVQDTGNPIICLLMCGNFTLSFLILWLQLCPRASLPGNHSWDYLFIFPGKCPPSFFLFNRNRHYRKLKPKVFSSETILKFQVSQVLLFSADGSCRHRKPSIMWPELTRIPALKFKPQRDFFNIF